MKRRTRNGLTGSLRRSTIPNMKFVADNRIPYLQGVLEPYAEVVYREGRSITSADLKDADALIVRTRTKCDAALLERTGVRFIATATIGYDHIDKAYCAANGIAWTNAEGCNSASVQQYIASALVHFSTTMDVPLEGRTIGIVGVGNVGSKVARLCSALGMRILAFSKVQDAKAAQELGFAYAPFDRVLAESDVISIHVPLLPDTTHLLDDAAFKKMKKGVIIINTARGGIIDTMALVRALQSGIVGGAGLDVLEEEADLIAEHNHLDASTNDAALKTLLADHVLLGLDNVVITPHNAFNSSEAIERILMTTIDNVAAFLAGKPQNVVH